MKKILIIGGAGFIGINSARYFIKKGWKVTIFDNLSRAGTEFNLKSIKRDFGDAVEFIKGDITKDTNLLDKAVAKNDVVLHLAAQVAVTTSISDPSEDFRINALGTFKVLESIRKLKNKPSLLYSSTNKVYGALHQFPVIEKGSRYVFKSVKIRSSGVSEDVQLDFHSPYGCSKGAADQYVLDYSRIYGLKTVVFRQSCVYGEHQMGMEDQGWVAWFAIAALLGKKITIFGNGKQVRDLLYVGDLVHLYEIAIKNIEKIKGEAFNVGGGSKNTLSLIECLDILGKKLDLNIKIGKDKIRAGDQPIFIADNSKAGKLLGWKPSVFVEEGLDRMISWIINNQKVVEKSRR
ncbi:MAG: NAD-dependent epimerase/dehydratase family protein [Minisyncoccota bacterium]